MNCLLVLSLAVLGASAAPCGVNIVSGIGCGNIASGIGCGSVASGIGCGVVANQGCATALQGRTIYAQTPVVENPTAVFPAILPSTSVSQSCQCMKTIVRPQIRNEIITVPTVDRVVRVVTSPVVEVSSVNCGGNTRNYPVATCGSVEGVSTGVIGGAYPTLVSGGFQGVTGGCGYQGVTGGCGYQGFGGVINNGCGCSVVA